MMLSEKFTEYDNDKHDVETVVEESWTCTLDSCLLGGQCF